MLFSLDSPRPKDEKLILSASLSLISIDEAKEDTEDRRLLTSGGVGVDAREFALEEELPNILEKKFLTAEVTLDKKPELSRVLFWVEMLWDPTTPDELFPAS
ncbi:hypothetical protein AO9_00330 [Chlamydia psittaci Mat116]|nr:hypothetical protein AO9_00330 [Chlamydia psittaci Mat116]